MIIMPLFCEIYYILCGGCAGYSLTQVRSTIRQTVCVSFWIWQRYFTAHICVLHLFKIMTAAWRGQWRRGASLPSTPSVESECWTRSIPVYTRIASSKWGRHKKKYSLDRRNPRSVITNAWFSNEAFIRKRLCWCQLSWSIIPVKPSRSSEWMHMTNIANVRVWRFWWRFRRWWMSLSNDERGRSFRWICGPVVDLLLVVSVTSTTILRN